MTREREILRELAIEARFAGEGAERVLDRDLPVALARQLVSRLEASGIEASWAPDSDDRLRAWVYAIEAA